MIDPTALYLSSLRTESSAPPWPERERPCGCAAYPDRSRSRPILQATLDAVAILMDIYIDQLERSEGVGEEELQTVLHMYKALADENRLRILGLLASREQSVEELAAVLGLRVPTVSHHLAKLREAGLLAMRADGTTHYYRLDSDALRAINRRMLTPESVAVLADDLETDAWDRKVLRDFFDGERLKEIPASRKKRVVVLEWLAARFEVERRYAEPELNAIIHRHHPDAATLRREMVGYGMLRREAGVYWRPADPGLTLMPGHGDRVPPAPRAAAMDELNRIAGQTSAGNDCARRSLEESAPK